MKAGAHDYLMKKDLARLAPAVRRERREAIVRFERRQAEEALRRHQAELELKVVERTAELTRVNELLTVSALQEETAAEERLLLLNQVEEERRRVAELAAEAEASLTQLEAVVSSMSEGLIIADLRANILTMNPAALALHGFASLAEAQRVLRHSPQLLEPRYADSRPLPPGEWPVARACQGETFANLQAQLRRLDTRDLWFASYSGTPVRNKAGEAILAIVTVRDVTIQKEAERFARGVHLAHLARPA